MRIVSLCPSLTELVFDLGRGADLVGITEYCVHPADGVAALEQVGGTKTPDVERIVELRPDIVLLNEEENRIEDADRLKEAGLACHASMPRDTAETAEMVRSIGEALGCSEEGERIALDIEARSARVRAEAEGEPPLSWAYLIWRKPWMSVSDDTFAAHLLNQAGGERRLLGRGAALPRDHTGRLGRPRSAPGPLVLRALSLPGAARGRAGRELRVGARALRPGRRRVPFLAWFAHPQRNRLRP